MDRPPSSHHVGRTRRSGKRLKLLATTLLVWAACDQPITNIEVERTEEGVVPGGSEVWAALEFHDYPVLVVRVEPPSRARGHVDDVRLRRLYLELAEPDAMGFDFADSAIVYVEADELPRMAVAEVERIMPGSTVVELDPLAADLTPYVEADEVVLTVTLDGHPPPRDVNLRGHVVLDVGVNASAACARAPRPTPE